MGSFSRLMLAVSFALLSTSNHLHATPGQDKKKEAPDAAAIAKLVQELGNPKFTERDKATKSLEAIGLPALGALRKASKGDDVEVVQRAKRLIEIIENSLDTLLADYRGYGLPLPPDDAKLVRFEYGGQYVNGIPTPTTYFLGFQLRPGSKEKPPLLLIGTLERYLTVAETKTVEVVEPKAELVKSLDLDWWGQSTFDVNAGLAIALQCKARGWNVLAKELWTASLRKDIGHGNGGFYHPADLQGHCTTFLTAEL
jgi:hypothetical protein